MIKVQYTSTDIYKATNFARVRNVWGLTEFCFVFRFGFRATLLDYTSQIDPLYVRYYCADVWRVLGDFCSEYSRARPSTVTSGQVIDSACVCHSSHDADD